MRKYICHICVYTLGVSTDHSTALGRSACALQELAFYFVPTALLFLHTLLFTHI